jgi:DNA-binding NarL/FixJ family response regulator
MKRNQIRILCAEDHALMREGIELIIGLQPDLRIVASATNGAEAVELHRQHKPDITLMEDLQLPVMRGLDAICAIRREQPDAHIIVLTMYDGDADISRALKAGAAAYVLKDSVSADLIRVVREVHAGGRPVLANVEERLARRSTERGLTGREVEVLDLIAHGKRGKDVAALLGISDETVQAHLRNIYTKLDVKDRSAAIAVAVRRGYVHL